MDPQLLVVAGFIALAAGALLLLSFGSGFRIGRLLAATPVVPIPAAVAAAETGRAGYVGVMGRIDSEDAFPDSVDRPLVFRRTRIEIRRLGRWQTVEDGRESVPFSIREGLDGIAVDAGALGPGLVTLPREATGVAADLADRVPSGTRPDTPARALIQQVSAVEHALVLGVPVRRPDGSVTLSAGAGRPLVVSTLERDEAMRVLAGGGRWRPMTVAVLLATGLILVVAGLALGVVQAVLG